MPTTPFSRAPSRPGLASGAAASRARLRRRARSGSCARLWAGSSPRAASPCTHGYAGVPNVLVGDSILEFLSRAALGKRHCGEG